MKKRTRKAMALSLAMAMVFTMLTACGKDSDAVETTNTTTPTTKTEESSEAAGTDTEEQEPTAEAGKEKRVITIGTWYDHYYTSDHDDVYDNPEVSDVETAQMQLDNMRAIEEKYNVELRFVNLTWDGTMESINTSIMAGTPDCDIYEVDLQFGIPAALSGYAQPLESFIPADDDIFNDQTVMKYLNVLGMDQNYLFAGNSIQLGAYPLAFNMDMINEAGLENPQDLYDRGEWTWAKFREYMIALTKDNDGDGVNDVYGYGGWWTNLLSQLLMSNGANIAGSTTEGLSSPASIEVMDFIYNMYNTDKVAKPWNEDDWNINTSCYADGQIAFWPSAAWVFSSYGGSDLEFEIGVVPWPVGPSGNQETNNHYLTAGNYYIIPTGVEDPYFVYQVFYDWTNWFDGDTSLRDETEWFENQMMTERNFDYLKMMGTKEQFDIWGSLDVVSMVDIMNGTKTASQYAEENKQLVQAKLDDYFK